MGENKIELKPCPFCGNKDYLEVEEAYICFLDEWEHRGYTVRCSYCDLMFGYHEHDGSHFMTPEAAAEAWNRRSSDNNTHEVRKPFSDALYDALKAYIDCVDELKRLNAYYEAIKNAAREGKIV
ncbi:MAG: Lar family restriction alleviation protein [Synergistaceae bacterium]|nr:Lar family restriction alleviation protein [Synergistaceae bacterium]